MLSPVGYQLSHLTRKDKSIEATPPLSNSVLSPILDQ